MLGYSILDNAAYVPGRPAVIDQVRNRLTEGWIATLVAKDGSVIDDVHRQLARLPDDATHLALSAGGNDVLCEIGVLREHVATVGEGLRFLADFVARFESDYRRLMRAISSRGLPTVICTIYNPRFPEGTFQREAVAALAFFNDVIVRAAREFQVPVIDLRVVCSEISDFANEIEPSSAGGAKIAETICKVAANHEFGGRKAVLYP